MSETVHYIGTANLKVIGNKNCEKYAEGILTGKGVEAKDYYDNSIEQLCDLYDEEYFYHPKTEKLYEISYTERDNDDEVIEAKYVGFDNSQVGFELKFYNGGAGFYECLEEAMDKLK